MRILAILTPTDKWGTKTAYTNLRKFRIKTGYHLMGGLLPAYHHFTHPAFEIQETQNAVMYNR